MTEARGARRSGNLHRGNSESRILGVSIPIRELVIAIRQDINTLATSCSETEVLCFGLSRLPIPCLNFQR